MHEKLTEGIHTVKNYIKIYISAHSSSSSIHVALDYKTVIYAVIEQSCHPKDYIILSCIGCGVGDDLF